MKQHVRVDSALKALGKEDTVHQTLQAIFSYFFSFCSWDTPGSALRLPNHSG